MSFSPAAQKILRQAGWTDQRSYDPKPAERFVQDKSYAVFPALSAFLRRFGGLTFANPEAVPPAAEDWHFRVEDAIRHVTPKHVQEYSKILGSQLGVIGQGFGDYLLLMIDEQGRIYGGYDQTFLNIGDSADDALEALCTGRKLMPVEKVKAQE